MIRQVLDHAQELTSSPGIDSSINFPPSCHPTSCAASCPICCRPGSYASATSASLPTATALHDRLHQPKHTWGNSLFRTGQNFRNRSPQIRPARAHHQAVVLLGLHKRFHELGRDQADFASEAGKDGMKAHRLLITTTKRVGF